MTVPGFPENAFEAAAGRHESIDYGHCLTPTMTVTGQAGGCSLLCFDSRRPAGQSRDW